MFRIRFHGRGGQGVRVASRILGSAFFAQGYEVQDCPRYGAERRGAPIAAYVRAARHAIHERGVITNPDLVVVCDDTLVQEPAAGVLQGLATHTVVFILSAVPEETWRDKLTLPARIVTLAPGPLAAGAPVEQMSAACAGAAARLTGAVYRPALEQAIRVEIASFGDDALTANLSAALAAYDALATRSGVTHEGRAPDAKHYAPPQWVYLAPEPAPLSAPDIVAAATSVESHTALWRTLRPVIDEAHCNHCSWICTTYCPDSAISAGADRVPHIDYDHCKGCLVCMAVCPPHAIRAVPEGAVKATA